MGALMIFIGCVIIIIGIIIYDKNRVHYTSWYKEGKPCLSFEEFISLYNVNPDKWKITEEWDWDNYENYNIIIYSAQRDVLTFGWKTDHDRIDYLKWAGNKKRYEQNIKTAETLAKLTKDVRKDIKFYNEKTQNKAQETYDRILKMMEEE